ncbi:MAG: hypothetical protein ACM3O4_02460 [Ignavibacteriales bacterium]
MNNNSTPTTKGATGASLGGLLLDSSLISQTNNISYTIKLIECGDYYYLYYFNYTKKKKIKNEDVRKIDINSLFKKENKDKQPHFIEYKNILRSKFSLQRLIKSNEKEFKTFITLTYADNTRDIDIKQSNKTLNIFLTQIRRIKKDFKYVCVPEYQKKREQKYGFKVIHYHLLTNLKIGIDNNVILPQKDGRKNCYDIKYWNYGMSSTYSMENINVVGYLSKYMTKDIDNRLFNKRRYLYSQNLKHPKEYFLNTENDKDFEIIAHIKSNYNKKYENSYYSIYDNYVIDFQEYYNQS